MIFTRLDHAWQGAHGKRAIAQRLAGGRIILVMEDDGITVLFELIATIDLEATFDLRSGQATSFLEGEGWRIHYDRSRLY